MNPEPTPQKAVLASDLDSQAADLLRLATELGISMRDENPKRSPVETPDIKGQLERSIRESLEDEIVPIVTLQNGGIDENEVDREVIKKALVSLKLTTLRRIAKDQGTTTSGTQEDVATRIARRYQWDRTAVAKLILANEDEPSIERGHISRVFPFGEAIDLSTSSERLASIMGRYIRIGVARWFLFESCSPLGEGMEVKGTYKTYQAAVDDRFDTASLAATPYEATVRILVGKNSSLQVLGASTVPSKAAVKAFEVITGNRAKGHLPLADRRAKGISSRLHPTSEFLLDLLYNRLNGSTLGDINLTVARFNVRPENDPSSKRTVSERRPELRAVRFEGEHLLDSIPACRLLAIESRPLVEVAFHASISGESEGTRARFPIRVTAEADHVSIQTGLGESEHELSLQVHRFVVEACTAGLSQGIADVDRVATLFERMKKRADSKENPKIADIFSENDDF